MKLTLPVLALAIATVATPAMAGRWMRDATTGFYGGLGAYGGALYGGPAGAVIGGSAGSAVGGWVYDTHREFFSQPPRYRDYYAPRQYRTFQTTPYMRMRRY